MEEEMIKFTSEDKEAIVKVSQKKRELEKIIFNLINHFQEMTGTKITAINFNQEDVMYCDSVFRKGSIITKFSIDIDLGDIK